MCPTWDNMIMGPKNKRLIGTTRSGRSCLVILRCPILDPYQAIGPAKDMVPRENCISGAPPALIMPVDVDDFLQGETINQILYAFQLGELLMTSLAHGCKKRLAVGLQDMNPRTSLFWIRFRGASIHVQLRLRRSGGFLTSES